MLYDVTVQDAAFKNGREPEDIHQLIAWARQTMGLNGNRPWRLISARRRFGKTLFEIEEECGGSVRRLIGKRCSPRRALSLQEALTSLRAHGFQAPAKYTVPEPIACVADQGFILQEKAPGIQASEIMLRDPRAACEAAESCAQWLAALHGTDCPSELAEDRTGLLESWLSDLMSIEPSLTQTLESLGRSIRLALASSQGTKVPCHGDFHPMNVLIAGYRITAIDLDKFGAAEPESDVGYFLMQTAAFDFFKNGSFSFTRDARKGFLDTYHSVSRHSIDASRAAAYMALAFLKNLHFEMVLLKTGNKTFVEPWLNGATQALSGPDLILAA